MPPAGPAWRIQRPPNLEARCWASGGGFGAVSGKRPCLRARDYFQQERMAVQPTDRQTIERLCLLLKAAKSAGKRETTPGW